VIGTLSCTNLSVTNPPWPSLPTNPTFTTVNVSQDNNAYTVNGYSLLDIGSNGIRTSARVNYGLRTTYACTLYGADYVQFFIGNTERGYFHSGGLHVTNTISCANLSVSNPPWPTSVSLPSSPSFSGTVYGNKFSAGSDAQAYMINGYEMLDIASSNIRVNYGLRSNYSTNVYGATYVRFFIGSTERAYVSSSGMNNSSIAEQKEGIRNADSALVIVRDARLYQYRYTLPDVAQAVAENSEATRAAPQVPPERMGFVIGEGYEPPPACVLAEDGNGVNLYAMASVCWRGLQELLARVDALEKAL
jgi:hypothetical protein